MAEATEKVAGIILAAGTSSRMGETKQLLKIGGKFLVERVVQEALHSNLGEVVVVLGHQAGSVRDVLAPAMTNSKLRVVENAHYRAGMSSSIRAGLEAVEKSADHVMILLGDMPHITAHVINTLMSQYLASGQTLGAVSVQGRRSHPVILGRPWYPALRDLRGDVGARALFDAFQDKVCLVGAPPAYDDLDLDTWEDYRKALLKIPE